MRLGQARRRVIGRKRLAGRDHQADPGQQLADLAMQLAAAEAQKCHKRLAEQLRLWAEASKTPSNRTNLSKPTPLAAPRGDLAGLLSASYPTTRLSDVILPPHLGDELAHIVVETRMTEQLESKGLRPRRRLLLAGPPGTGKTLTAAALAGELKYPLFSALLHGLITKFMGETAQKLRMVFDAVRTTRGVYLFDEIDALAAARGAENDVGEARRILNSFLQFLDEDTGPSIVVATTNLPQILDRAILRRFDLVLPYEMPAGPAIEKAMRRRLGGFDVREVNWSEVANNAGGLSTADVVAAAEDAAPRSLHGIGMDVNAEGSSTLHVKRSGAARKIQGQGRRVNQKTK